MKRTLESARYLILIGVIGSLIASAAAFTWAGYKTFTLLVTIVQTGGEDIIATVGLVAIMDKFLIATGLYIFAVGIYELFIGDLELPDWLVTHSLHQIKGRLSSIIILLLAIIFLEHVIEWKNAQDILMIGIGIAVVAGALLAFNVFGERE